MLDADTWEALHAQITARRRGRRPTGRYLLTGLARCSKCKRTMNGATNTRSGARIYRCPPQLGGCGRSVDAASVEDMAGSYMVKLLADPANVAAVAERERALTGARAEQLARVEAVEDQLADLEVKWASGELVQRAYDRAKPVLDRRLAAEQARLGALEHPAAPLPADAAADWAVGHDAEKRILIQRYGVQITVGQHRPGARQFDPARVRITR